MLRFKLYLSCYIRQPLQKKVNFIDEYDVPLDKAFQNGYYKEMVSLIRAIFGKALKTNEAFGFCCLNRLSSCFKRKYFYRI